jgi:hypothetical protein
MHLIPLHRHPGLEPGPVSRGACWLAVSIHRWALAHRSRIFASLSSGTTTMGLMTFNTDPIHFLPVFTGVFHVNQRETRSAPTAFQFSRESR